jgi:hypothetical protein
MKVVSFLWSSSYGSLATPTVLALMCIKKVIAGLMIEFYAISETFAFSFSNTGTLQKATRFVDDRSAKCRDSN